jgi:hypothetical protein
VAVVRIKQIESPWNGYSDIDFFWNVCYSMIVGRFAGGTPGEGEAMIAGHAVAASRFALARLSRRICDPSPNHSQTRRARLRRSPN